MSLKTVSDETATVAGIATTGALTFGGCPVVDAMLLGSLAEAIDIPFGSIALATLPGKVVPATQAAHG